MADERFFGGRLSAAAARAAGEKAPVPAQERHLVLHRPPDFPRGKIGLRSTAGEQYTIVDEETGDIVGHRRGETAFSALHPGAVYLHMGDTYLVTELDLDRRVALVRPFWDTYHTLPRRETDTRIISETPADHARPADAPPGRDRRHQPGGGLPEAADRQPRGRWAPRSSTCPPRSSSPRPCGSPSRRGLFPAEADLVRLPGAIHAVEHALIALLPLFAMCDRWDIGGLSTPVHSQTEQPTIFVYDGHAGGVGIIPAGLRALRRVGAATPDRLVRDCPCESGCPSCVQSPKCGNWNEPLDKEQALEAAGRDARHDGA